MQRLFAKKNYRIQTDAIKEHLLVQTKQYLYSDEADLLNLVLFDMKANKFA